MCSLATLFCAEEEHDDDALLPWLLPEAADVEAEAETLGPELLELTEAGDTVRAGLGTCACAYRGAALHEQIVDRSQGRGKMKAQYERGSKDRPSGLCLGAG